jgi:hypothetical protein
MVKFLERWEVSEMRIGVVCEGPTDYIAIEAYIGSAMAHLGVEASFVPIQPDMDNTRKDGGWSRVLQWLAMNPPSSRVSAYLSAGLFAGPLSAKICDILLIQMDSDILGDEGFENFVLNNLSHAVANPSDPGGRADEIQIVLEKAAELHSCVVGDREKHVLAPSVDSTETWCLASFARQATNPELLRERDLTVQFMRALEQSESRVPLEDYSNCDKSLSRRRAFCIKHSSGIKWLLESSSSFQAIVSKLEKLS